MGRSNPTWPPRPSEAPFFHNVVTFQKEVGTVRFPTKGQQPVPKFAFALPLLIQALPLSLKTFWRYLLVLPLLAIVPLVLLLVGFIPLIGIIAPGVAYAFCIMIGLRSTLVARGHTPQADFGQMLRYGTVFSLLTMVATSLINALSALLPLPVYLALGWFNGLANGDPRILIMAGGIFGLYILLMLIWSASIAVPMTAAVAYGDAKGGGLNPFRGLGTGGFRADDHQSCLAVLRQALVVLWRGHHHIRAALNGGPCAHPWRGAGLGCQA